MKENNSDQYRRREGIKSNNRKKTLKKKINDLRVLNQGYPK